MPQQTSLPIGQKERAFITKQEMFFVATAPLAADGLVNLSPKGVGGTFVVLDSQTVAYLDLWGSGIETTAHIRENGRLCIMFCSFDEVPNSLRLHGRGDIVEPDHLDFESLATHFPETSGTRAIIRLHVTRAEHSCGFGVPRYTFVGHRSQLQDIATKRGPKAIAEATRKKNTTSIDGLPGTDFWSRPQ
jgi:hypothetical protein